MVLYGKADCKIYLQQSCTGTYNSHRHARGLSCQQPQLPNILWMWHQGHSFYLTHRGTHLCVCKGAPRLAAFLYVSSQVNE